MVQDSLQLLASRVRHINISRAVSSRSKLQGSRFGEESISESLRRDDQDLSSSVNTDNDKKTLNSEVATTQLQCRIPLLVVNEV